MISSRFPHRTAGNVLCTTSAAVRSHRIPRPLRRRRNAGFTLIELMVVVVLVMIMAGLAAPGFARTMAITRAQRVSHSLRMMGMQARSEAMASGRAHYVRFAGQRVEVWRGTSSLCRATPWATVLGDCTSDPPDSRCTGSLDADAYEVGPHSVQLSYPDGQLDLCYQPNGDMLVTANSGATFALPNLGAVQVEVLRMEDGASADVVRGTVFPAAGVPRAVR